MTESEKLSQALAFVKERTGDFAPEVVLILGSGLGFLADVVEKPIAIPTQDIPHYPVSTAPGHAGRLVLGTLAGKNVAVIQGRVHYYEGYNPETIVFGLRLVRQLGASTLIVTNASGGVRPEFDPGQIVLISDHICLFGVSPLRGANLPELGVRFPDMSETYSRPLRVKAHAVARKLGIGLSEGVYLMTAGPQYETPAEIRAYSRLGADLVGMSTVPEVIAARHAGMQILGFSLVCNTAAGMTANHELSEEEVLDTASRAKESFSSLILSCLAEL
jgi:purine-nucleoside phosphorylase